MSTSYDRQSFHGYGVEYIVLHGNEHEHGLLIPEEQGLAMLGLQLFIYMDRLIYADCDTNPLLRSMDQLIHTVSSYPSTPELDLLNMQHARLRELIEEHTLHDYGEIIVLSEWFVTDLIRIKSMMSEMGVDLQQYMQCIQQMSAILQEMSEHFSSLVLRHFDAALMADKYQTIAAICMGSSFLSTMSHLLIVFITEDDHPWIEEARKSCFDTEYSIAALCSLGVDFDFQQFDEEMEQ